MRAASRDNYRAGFHDVFDQAVGRSGAQETAGLADAAP